MTPSTVLIFLLSALIGVLIGGAVCVRFLSAINLVLVTRYAELGREPRPMPAYRLPGGEGEAP